MIDVVQLKQVNLFEEVDDGMLELVVPLCERREFTTGQTLFRADEVAEEIIFLLSGRVALTVPISVFMVERELQIDSKGPGDLLGWSALVPPNKYTLTATCAEPGEGLAVGREALLRCCEEHPAMGFAVMSNVARIVGERLVQVKALLIKEVERSIRLV